MLWRYPQDNQYESSSCLVLSVFPSSHSCQQCCCVYRCRFSQNKHQWVFCCLSDSDSVEPLCWILLWIQLLFAACAFPICKPPALPCVTLVRAGHTSMFFHFYISVPSSYLIPSYAKNWRIPWYSSAQLGSAWLSIERRGVLWWQTNWV